jgi:hypothetical protein
MAISIFGCAAWASPITYTESGQLSGTLGNTTFTNADFTFVLNGDTTGISNTTAQIVWNLATSNSFTIGLLNGSFTSPVAVAVNQAPGRNLGFAYFPNGVNGFPPNAAVTFISGAPAGYVLATPISVSAILPSHAGATLSTDIGTLTITDAQNLSFIATVSVPEPSSLSFIGTGLLGLATVYLRRKHAEIKSDH